MMIGERLEYFSTKLWQLICAVALLSASGTYAANADSEEQKAGEDIVAIYLGAAPLTDDVDLNRYVSLVGKRVADQSERRALQWTFGVLDSESVNAFSAPGGFVLLTKGLLEMLETEDELAAVLGHEVAHITRQHHWKIIKQQKDAAMIIAKMQGNMKGGNELFSEMNSLFSDMMTRGLDKGAEFEADRDAVILAANAGYDCLAILSLLEKLDQLKSNSDSSSLLFQTHPSPAERIDEVISVLTPDMDACAVTSPAATRYQKLIKPIPQG